MFYETINEFFNAIVTERADLKAQPYVVANSGQQSIVLEINGEFFKTPLYEASVEEFCREINVIEFLNDRGLAFSIPQITTIGADKKFFAMSKLDGYTLSQALKVGMPQNKQINLIDSYINIMKEISAAFDNNSIQKLGLRRMSQLSSWEFVEHALNNNNLYDALGDELFWQAKSLEKEIDTLKKWPYSNTISHGDLSLDNVIIDKATWDLRGVIDFGRVGFHPPELDLTRLTVLGPEFMRRFISSYIEETHAKISFENVLLLRKARMLAGIGIHLNSTKNTALLDENIREFSDLFEEKWGLSTNGYEVPLCRVSPPSPS